MISAPCPACDGLRLHCVVTLAALFSAELDDGLYIVTDADLSHPDVQEVSLYCGVCGYNRELKSSEWELA